VPDKMVRAIAAFIDFCYIVCHSTLDEADLEAMEDALRCFEAERTIFKEVQIHPNGISIPQIHALQHYHHLVQQFGAPNGLCSSITGSKYIQAVKKPWRKSNQHNALGQMLITNQHLDNIASFRANRFAEGKHLLQV
ncbi:hypothetical protein PAXINDRAFT_81955, partial [Paxillus involutus ATCC 200175]